MDIEKVPKLRKIGDIGDVEKVTGKVFSYPKGVK
jgi:hypothetical protein